jgi:hypothetical protein
VPYQYYSPEKNLYHHTNQMERFNKRNYIKLRLPFFGEWFVSQGYNGNITHKEEWSEAIDFVVVNETQHTYNLPGKTLTDFLCYNLPVLAPADGYVCEVVDGIEENELGEVNTQQNWGNTIVIKHIDGLYSKLSHLKKESFTVRVNDYVKAGQVIATCGSSGRSPEPHLHFQLQATPYIGSPTLAYPMGYFMSRNNAMYTLHEYEIPDEATHLHHPITTPLLQDVFQFTPGKKLRFNVRNKNAEPIQITWECAINAWNQMYLYCIQSGAMAYFVNDGTLFYFTEFYGSKQSLLYEFYMGAQRILLGYYEQMTIHDSLAVTKLHTPYLLWLQDFIAPFYRFMHVQYEMHFTSIDNLYAPQHIEMKSRVKALLGNSTIHENDYHFIFSEGKIAQWNVTHNNQLIYTVTCTD